MKLSTTPVLIFAFLFSYCTVKEKFISIEEIKNLYPDLIHPDFNISEKRKSYSFTINKKLPAEHPFKKLGSDYQLYTDYLIWNSTGIDIIKILNASKDSAAAAFEYLRLLKSDSLFNANFLPVVASILKQKKITVLNYTPPDKFSITDKILVQTAARFFYAYSFDSASNSLRWYICVGKNPYYSDSTLTKLPQVEAFCFMTLLNYKLRKKSFFKEFSKKVSEINNEIKAIDGVENKLIYARKEMTKTMYLSDDLKNTLLDEYKKHSKLLPFTIQ